MLISSIETFASEYVTLVRVRTDDGDEGWGQVSPYNADLTAEVVHRQVARHVIGMDASDIDAVTSIVLDREHKFQGTYLYRALCGVDTALWDIRGKRVGQSGQRLLGGGVFFVGHPPAQEQQRCFGPAQLVGDGTVTPRLCRLAFQRLQLGVELLDQSGSVVATGEVCTPSVDFSGKEAMCIDVPAAQGTYFVRVTSTGAANCSGECDYNQYTLDIRLPLS